MLLIIDKSPCHRLPINLLDPVLFGFLASPPEVHISCYIGGDAKPSNAFLFAYNRDG